MAQTINMKVTYTTTDGSAFDSLKEAEQHIIIDEVVQDIRNNEFVGSNYDLLLYPIISMVSSYYTLTKKEIK